MIIVDSNVFIFSESPEAPKNKMALNKIYEAYQTGRIGVNVVIASETFHKLQKFFDRSVAAETVSKIVSDEYTDFLGFGVDTVARATKLARDFHMRINDALIAQQAIETGSAILTDNVKDFRKIKSIRVISLRN